MYTIETDLKVQDLFRNLNSVVNTKPDILGQVYETLNLVLTILLFYI